MLTHSDATFARCEYCTVTMIHVKSAGKTGYTIEEAIVSLTGSHWDWANLYYLKCVLRIDSTTDGHCIQVCGINR